MRAQASRGRWGVKQARRIADRRGARVIHLRRTLALRPIVSELKKKTRRRSAGPRNAFKPDLRARIRRQLDGEVGLEGLWFWWVDDPWRELMETAWRHFVYRASWRRIDDSRRELMETAWRHFVYGAGWGRIDDSRRKRMQTAYRHMKSGAGMGRWARRRRRQRAWMRRVPPAWSRRMPWECGWAWARAMMAMMAMQVKPRAPYVAHAKTMAVIEIEA